MAGLTSDDRNRPEGRDDPEDERDARATGEGCGQFGRHPDPLIDAHLEIERLQGLLCEAHGGLLRALDYRAATPEGLSIKYDVRDALRRTGFAGNMGERAEF